MEYKLLINGQWLDGGDQLEVTNKYTQEVFAVVRIARQEDVEAAIDAAQRAAPIMADMPAYQKAEILANSAVLIDEHREELAETIASEAGKAL
jgi:acyl-CoA reductase-like NAD-dependent aldehyde dehydrogenase